MPNVTQPNPLNTKDVNSGNLRTPSFEELHKWVLTELARRGYINCKIAKTDAGIRVNASTRIGVDIIAVGKDADALLDALKPQNIESKFKTGIK
jgi:hypothetical protein